MAETLSHRFIAALQGPRDRLYTLALAKTASSAAAEALLQERVRQLFAEVARDAVPDIPAALEKSLSWADPAAPSANVTLETPMPADVWSRIAAAIQIEAARSTNSHALNPDSVLLRPDPLLAPKKSSRGSGDDEFDLASPSRMILVLGGALLIGLVVTIFILTRPAPQRPATHPGSPTSRPATSQPAPHP